MDGMEDILRKKFSQRRFNECIELCNTLIQDSPSNAFAYLVRSASKFILKNQYKDENFTIKDIPSIMSDYKIALKLDRFIHKNNPDVEFYIYSPYCKISFGKLPTAKEANQIIKTVHHYDSLDSIRLVLIISAVISIYLYLKGVQIYLSIVPFFLIFSFFLMKKLFNIPKRKTWKQYSKDFGCKIELIIPKYANPVWWKEDEYSIEAKELFKYDIDSYSSDFQLIIELCTRALEKNPNDAIAYYIRAMANFSGQKAIDDYNKAIEIDKCIVKDNPEIKRRFPSPEGMAYIFNRPITEEDYNYLTKFDKCENYEHRKEFPKKYGCKTETLTWAEIK